MNTEVPIVRGFGKSWTSKGVATLSWVLQEAGSTTPGALNIYYRFHFLYDILGTDEAGFLVAFAITPAE